VWIEFAPRDRTLGEKFFTVMMVPVKTPGDAPLAGLLPVVM